MKYLTHFFFLLLLLLGLLFTVPPTPAAPVTAHAQPHHTTHGEEYPAVKDNSLEAIDGETFAVNSHQSLPPSRAQNDPTGKINQAMQTGWAEGQAGSNCESLNSNSTPWHGLACDAGSGVACIFFDSSLGCSEQNFNGSSPNAATGRPPLTFFGPTERGHISVTNNVLSNPTSVCDQTGSRPITIDPRGRVASVQLSQADYDQWVANDEFSTFTSRSELTERLYCEFNDEFDFIFFILNESQRPATIPYSGKYYSVRNDVQGIGTGLFDNSAGYGSAGRLQGVMQLPARNLLRFGPALHEVMHRWGNFGITTHSVSVPGANVTSFPFIPHWGFTGGSTKGQLGGFEQSSLEELGGNQYRIGSFGPFANGGNSVPYTELERYLAGFLAAEDVQDFDMFTDITSLDVSAGSTFTFTANERTTFTPTDLTNLLGPRIPDVTTSQKDFRLLTVVITPTPLDQAQWDEVDAQSAWFGLAADDGTSLYNFWEATQGVGRMQTDGLFDALPVDLASFTATAREKVSVLEWATQAELENYGFHVQRMDTEGTFNTIGWVDGRGTPGRYGFTDNRPRRGENFYRLLQEDFDGSTTPSPIRLVSHALDSEGLILSPNPSSGRISLRTGSGQTPELAEVYTAKGELVRTFRNTTELLLTELPAGMYLIRVNDGGKLETKRLMLRPE